MPTRLNPREVEVARLVSESLTVKRIAQRLGSSPHTVRTQIASIGKKIGGHGTPMRRITRFVFMHEVMFYPELYSPPPSENEEEQAA